MNILSLFDGISCARVALERAGIPVKNYYTSEVDPNAIAISNKNYPDCIRLGDVREIKGLPQIDLLIGGSPCQDLSRANTNRRGLQGERSRLFWEFVRLWTECKPKWFVLENVASMSSDDKDCITKTLGVEPVLFDAALVSAQSRKRLFWTNIPFTLPKDKGIRLKDILEPIRGEIREGATLFETPKGTQLGYFGPPNQCKVGGQGLRLYSCEGKSPTSGVGLFAVQGGIRRLTVVECERLQGLPDTYTEGISKTHRLKCIHNAFNVDVIIEILKPLGLPRGLVSEEKWKSEIEFHGRF